MDTPSRANDERRSAAHWGAFTADIVDGRIDAIRPFAHDEHPSPLIHAIPSAVYAASRVARPSVRAGWLERGAASDRSGRGREPFVEVTWDRALDLVAGELARVRTSFGNSAIFGGSYGWASAGRFHHAKTLLQRFLNGFGGYTGQTGNYSYAAGLAILPHVIGTIEPVDTYVTAWPSIAEHTELFVAFGGLPVKNMQIDAGATGDHASLTWLHRCIDRRVHFTLVSPIMDEGAEVLGSDWIRLRPNSDVALMLALAHTLYVEGLHDQAFLDRHCRGFDRFLPYLLGATDGRPKSAEWAAALTGVDAETIRALARRMARSRTMIASSWSMQRMDHGEQPFWMTVTLAAMLGQIGRPGCGFGFGYGSLNGMGNTRRRIASPAMTAGTNPIDSTIPVARVADMLLHPGASVDFNGRRITFPDIRLVYWCGGNPFHHHQDINRLLDAWRRPETIVVHEPWWTSTARHADIVLPATTPYEREDIAAGRRDRYVLAMDKLIDPVGDARDDYAIFADLAGRLGHREAFTEGRDTRGWLRHLYDGCRSSAARSGVELPGFDAFWRAGHVELPETERPYVLFEGFRADPEGAPLQTPSGRIEIYSERIERFGYDDCPPHASWLEPLEWLGSTKAARHPLHLVSNQPKSRLHSQLDDASVSRASKIRGREPIWMNPVDAAARSLGAGDVVRVFNDRGAMLAGVVLTQRVMPGVVQVATGAWYDPLVPGQIGTLDRHGNPNVLTPDKGTSKLGQGPSSGSCLVEVEGWREPLPDIAVFSPPPLRRRPTDGEPDSAR